MLFMSKIQIKFCKVTADQPKLGHESRLNTDESTDAILTSSEIAPLPIISYSMCLPSAKYLCGRYRTSYS